MTNFETRSHEHAAALTHQLREAVTEYAAEMELTGEKLAKLLVDADIEYLNQTESVEVNDESCEWMLEHAGELGLADCLVILEALGAEVNITVLLPVEAQKKLLTPRTQHRLQVARHLDDLPRKLQKRRDR